MTERTRYKLPAFFLGQIIHVLGIKERAPGDNRTPGLEDLEIIDRPATPEDIQPGCRCTSALQAFFCSTGHMTECHVGLDCRAANCSHLDRYE